ncbi:acyl-CoA synthetase, partial [Massilibacterium senegalense]|uniref:acyl-CoA synthetase n=1 Tax=Massilibacterium senegalense TaxID=1632858 RepID=UPI00078023CF
MLVPKALISAIRKCPNKIGSMDEHVQYTYQELGGRVAKLKQALQSIGSAKGKRVGLLMFNTPAYVEVLYAVMSYGGIVAPLNVRLSAPELIFIINDAKIETLFFHQEFKGIVEKLQDNCSTLKHIVMADDFYVSGTIHYESWIASFPSKEFTVDPISDEEVAGLFYTGGTTGKSKGVMLTHKNLVNNAYHAAMNAEFTKEERYLHAAPMFHLADGAFSFGVTIAGGSHVYLRSFTPANFLKVLETLTPTSTLLVPTMINMVINEASFHTFDTSSLQKIIYGASPMSVEGLKKAKKKLPNVKFYQAYGMTEAAPILTMLSAEDHEVGDKKEEQKRLASCGKPVQHVELKIVDPTGNEVPPYQVGEIVARGPNIMKGYWNLPDETKAALRNGWYYSGDLAYKDEQGYYYIVDRAKDMIITGGENVYTTEVENVLYSLSDIKECAVVGIPDETWGEKVTAIVVKKERSELTEQTIKEECRKKLANYKVPKTIIFTNELPKSGAGKI